MNHANLLNIKTYHSHTHESCYSFEHKTYHFLSDCLLYEEEEKEEEEEAS